ncbi:hypothetical protein MADA3029_680064 [Vibrio nigripulchritudo MADA3029]|nr:hypothetical protein MADA3029_680064 [Vibrio nigripulchritudo MADA3029]
MVARNRIAKGSPILRTCFAIASSGISLDGFSTSFRFNAEEFNLDIHTLHITGELDPPKRVHFLNYNKP